MAETKIVGINEYTCEKKRGRKQKTNISKAADQDKSERFRFNEVDRIGFTLFTQTTEIIVSEVMTFTQHC